MRDRAGVAIGDIVAWGSSRSEKSSVDGCEGADVMSLLGKRATSKMVSRSR